MSGALELLAGLVLDSGETWGQVAHPFQVEDARAILEGDRRWHFVCRPRGMSKTTDVAGCGLCLLVTDAPEDSRSYVVAVDSDQAGFLLDAVRGFVLRTPGLGVRVESRRVVAENRATLEVLSSDAASAWGLRPWMVLVDEASAWPTTPNHRQLWGALVSAVPKVKGSRFVTMTSAGAPSHPSFQLWERAKTDPRWRTTHRPGPCPWWAPDDVEMMRSELLPSEFRRLVLNEWAESEDRLSTADDVSAAVAHSGPLPPRGGVRYVLALDVGLRRDRTALVVAHLEQGRDGARVVVDRVDVWQGTPADPVELAEVQQAIAATSRSYNRAPLVFDPYQAAQLAQQLRREGVPAVEFTFSVAGVNRLARTLFQLLRDHLLAIPDDPELVRELAAVRLVETSPGLFRIDHDRGAHDDRAIAVAMAATTLLERPLHSRVRITTPARRHIVDETALPGEPSLAALRRRV